MTLFVRAEEFVSLQSFMFVSTSVVEFLDSTPYACPLIHWPRLFVVVFHEVYCLHISQYDEVHGVTGLYLPSFMFFSAVVSEICLLNGKKNNLEIYSLQFITSPSHIIYCVVLQFKPELPYGHLFTLTKLKLRKLQTESIISDFIIYKTNGKP